MDLMERTIDELGDIIEAIVLQRTDLGEHEVRAIYGSEQERQLMTRSLAERTQSGKTWFELVSWWSKLDDVAKTNANARRARSAYDTLVNDDPFKTCIKAEHIAELATDAFWGWCRTNQVAFIPTENSDWWMLCVLNASEQSRIEHEFAAMLREARR